MNKFYIFDVRGLYVPEVFNMGLLRVPASRREKVLRFKPEGSRVLSLGAGLLFDRMLSDMGFSKDVRRNLEFTFGVNGKPSVDLTYSGKPVCFNLSHSGDYVCGAVSEFQVGVDIQKQLDLRPALVRATLSEEELEKFAGLPEDTSAFYSIWSSKEAFLKMKGTGINCKPCEIKEAEYEPYIALKGTYRDHSFALCCEEKQKFETIILEDIMLPKEPQILLSMVNMKLRDFYSSLDALCDDLDEDKEEIISILKSAGYVYNEDLNCFK